MSDIVERLRLDAAQFAPGGNMVHRGYYQRDVTEAADEIERMKHGNRALEGILASAIVERSAAVVRAESAERERDALKAEVERLRGALVLARRSVVAQHAAEHMLDGFGPRKPRPSDDDLAAVDAALNHEGERG